MGQSCSKQHDDDQKPSQKTPKKATAAIAAAPIDGLAASDTTIPSPSPAKEEAAIGATYSSTVFGRLDDSGRSLQQMIVSIDEGHAYYSALACEPFHRAVRDRFPNGTGTTTSSVLSSSERFIWTYTQLPEEARPPWWGPDLCRKIAAAGQLSALQWARNNNCDWNYVTCSEAAQGGHLEVLQWARASDCDWDSSTCRFAARGGHLEVLQWARANGCDWNYTTCSAAAQGGHLEVLQWARANGCGWDYSTCRLAARGGHLEVLQWARDNGCPEP